MSEANFSTMNLLTVATTALRHNQVLQRVPNSPANDMFAITGTCVFTGVNWTTNPHPADLLAMGLRLWAQGTHAQSALYFMSAGEREFLISGISPAGWDMMAEDDIENEMNEPGDREPFFPPTL